MRHNADRKAALGLALRDVGPQFTRRHTTIEPPGEAEMGDELLDAPRNVGGVRAFDEKRETVEQT